MRMLSMLVFTLTAAGCQSEKKDGASVSAAETTKKATAPSTDKAGVTRVTSKDGTEIAFETAGKGPPLIIVSGALSSRAMLGDNTLVVRLAEHFTVYTYDRRGRGESTDVTPYAVAREIDDLDALIAHAGHSAYVYGVSSGAALAMQAAAALGPVKVTKLALYEPPYGQAPAAFAKQKQGVGELVKTGKPGDAAEFFMTAIGTPRDVIDGMRRSGKWDAIARIDFTLAYDFEVLGDGAIPEGTARAITVPVLVLTGEKTMAFMHPTADRIAKLMPDAQRKTLVGQTHQAQGDVVAPALIAFFTRGSS